LSAERHTPPEEAPKVGVDEVRKMAFLARLSLDEAEIPGLVEHFRKMLQFFESIAEADDRSLEPFRPEARGLPQLREDRVLEPEEAGASLDQTAWQQNAPESEGPYFLVPRVVES